MRGIRLFCHEKEREKKAQLFEQKRCVQLIPTEGYQETSEQAIPQELLVCPSERRGYRHSLAPSLTHTTHTTYTAYTLTPLTPSRTPSLSHTRHTHNSKRSITNRSHGAHSAPLWERKYQKKEFSLIYCSKMPSRHDMERKAEPPFSVVRIASF